MTEKTKLILVGVICALAAALICVLVIPRHIATGTVFGASESVPTHLNASATRMNDTYMYGDFEVNGTTYLNGATALHAITATTLAPTGISTMATTSMTALCVWNGTQWVKITFSGATPSYATSTTCL